MKPRRILAIWLFALGVAAAARSASFSEPILPSWADGEREAMEEGGWIAGSILLTDDPIPEETGAEESPPETAELDIAEPTAEEIAEPEDPDGEIPESFWPEYFGQRPESFLVDPQGLLSSVDFRDRLAFLNYHAGDSNIDLFVYLIKGGQEFPGEVREEELVERCFSTGRPAAVVFYFLGAPQRSMISLSPSLTDAVSSVEQRRALDSSVMQALEKTDPVDQFEAFLVQMSIRIYWMERMMGSGRAEPSGGAYQVARRAEEGESHGLRDKIQPVLATVKPHLPVGLVVLSAMICGWVANFVLRRRVRYRFPDFDVEQRLGGEHAAGIGAVISFASASLPPASQRDQVPDYLRRM
ncbi:MAG: hypothetical protein KDN05_15355 [Verrucomicrobiae bacterium]|nr:hypothetical protein [Verrucomicrobiae bacterium]